MTIGVIAGGPAAGSSVSYTVPPATLVRIPTDCTGKLQPASIQNLYNNVLSGFTYLKSIVTRNFIYVLAGQYTTNNATSLYRCAIKNGFISGYFELIDSQLNFRDIILPSCMFATKNGIYLAGGTGGENYNFSYEYKSSAVLFYGFDGWDITNQTLTFLTATNPLAAVPTAAYRLTYKHYGAIGPSATLDNYLIDNQIEYSDALSTVSLLPLTSIPASLPIATGSVIDTVKNSVKTSYTVGTDVNYETGLNLFDDFGDLASQSLVANLPTDLQTSISGYNKSCAHILVNGYSYLFSISTLNSSTGLTYETSVTYVAPVNPDGTLGAYVASGSSTPTAFATSNVFGTLTTMYAFGDGTNNLYSAPINTGGVLGTWVTTSGGTPASFTAEANAANANFLYVLSNNTVTPAMYKVPITNNALGTWGTDTNALLMNLKNVRLFMTTNVLYMFTENTSGDTELWYSPVDASGNIGTWVNSNIVFPDNTFNIEGIYAQTASDITFFGTANVYSPLGQSSFLSGVITTAYAQKHFLYQIALTANLPTSVAETYVNTNVEGYYEDVGQAFINTGTYFYRFIGRFMNTQTFPESGTPVMQQAVFRTEALSFPTALADVPDFVTIENPNVATPLVVDTKSVTNGVITYKYQQLLGADKYAMLGIASLNRCDQIIEFEGVITYQ